MGEFVHRKKSRIRHCSERTSNRLTRLIGAHFGEAWPQYYVSEYPRSGGTWLSGMLADYLDCVRPGPSVFPIGCRAVLHNHWKYHPKLKRVVYLMRDGRDVMTSYYFFRLRSLNDPGSAGYSYTKTVFDRAIGTDFDRDNTAVNLPLFMEYEFMHPKGAGRLNWAQHVMMWRPGRDLPNLFYMTYESLREDCVGAVTGCLRAITGEAPNERRVLRAVEHFSMESRTGRKPGEEDATSFVRKGITGDWVNHFTAHAAEVFDRHAGDALIAGGYEPDRDWIARYDLPTG
jgi:hypothetical protein